MILLTASITLWNGRLLRDSHPRIYGVLEHRGGSESVSFLRLFFVLHS